MWQYSVGTLFEKIVADVADPFTESPAINLYLSVVSDYFTKWSVVYPMIDQGAATVAEKLVRNWTAALEFDWSYMVIKDKL